MRSLAAEGRTVFVSSHLMSEMEHTADHLVVIGRGKLIAETAVTDFIAGSALSCVQVRTPQRDDLELAIIAAGGTVQPGGDGELEVRGLDVAQVGEIAHHNRILLQLLAPARASLEEAFISGVPAEVPGIDHTYESYATAFPDGRVTTCLARQVRRRGAAALAGRQADRPVPDRDGRPLPGRRGRHPGHAG
jgi:hypothetical protein